MTPHGFVSGLWAMVVEALDEEADPAKVYVLAAAFGLVVAVFQSPSRTLDFTTVDDLVRMATGRLMTFAAIDFAHGADAAGEAVTEALFRLVEITGVGVG